MNSKYYFLIIIILAVFLSFWKLGSGDVNQWDEAEYGTNAFEMMHTGDYVNYYYAGNIDTENAKPPLMVWAIVLCYKLFGYSAFALRFTAAAAAIVFFIFTFKLISLYGDKLLAFIACLVLLSCKAVIGFHVGRNGDTDALLICFLTGSVYYFLRYVDFEKRNAIFLFAIFTGLAFYAKGTAAFVLLPGLLIYAFARRKAKQMVLDYRAWLALLMVLLIAGSWIFIMITKGKAFNTDASYYKSHNALETLFYHDTYSRLTNSNFGAGSESARSFFFTVLDTRFNIWNYFFYLSLLVGLVLLVRKPGAVMLALKEHRNALLLLSLCIITTLFLMLTFAANKHSWYMAPLAPFIAIVIAKGIRYLNRTYKWFCFIWIPVLIFSLCRHFIYLNSPYEELSLFFSKNREAFTKSSSVIVRNMPTQDFFLYLNWNAGKVIVAENNEFKNRSKPQLVFYDSEKLKNDAELNAGVIDCNKQYCLSIIN